MKYYAVNHGRERGIFDTWAEAEKQVKGFSGAKFKSFSSYEEAESYLGVSTELVMTEIEAFVDGSFDKHLERYASGIVIVKNDTVIDKLSFSGSDTHYVDSYQIAGEVFAAIAAIQWGVANGYSDMTICYDYEGIRSWALGEWKTNKVVSQEYKKQFDDLSSKITVYFRKVKAHSGVTYNELADELAKKALLDNDAIEFSEKTSVDRNFYDYMISADGISSKESCIRFDGFTFNDKKIVNYLKFLWKKDGNKIGEVKKCSYQLDMNQRELLGYLELEDTVKEYRLKF